MKYIEAPQDYNPVFLFNTILKCKMKYTDASQLYNPAFSFNSIFLAGGITNCPDWQQDMVKLLEDTNATIFNPRRANFPIEDPNAALEQITWEHKALRDANEILFWFPRETICPIVLYELGAWSKTDKPIYVGVHPDYERRQDVEIQTKLVRPDVKIVYALDILAAQVIQESIFIRRQQNGE
jgi:hypothetical protein